VLVGVVVGGKYGCYCQLNAVVVVGNVNIMSSFIVLLYEMLVYSAGDGTWKLT